MTTNPWVEFVRKWASKHNQTYMCAASKKKCRDEYRALKAKNATKKVGVSRSGTKKSYNATMRKAKMYKKKTQRELLDKYPAYAEHKKRKEQL